MRNLILSGLAIVLAAVAACGGEGLLPEATLPLHEGRDAYTPAAAFGKDVYLLV